MAGNSLLTISMITREAIELFVNTNAFIKNLDRQYDSEFGKNGEKIGSQLRIRLPNDYTVRHGPAVAIQDTAEQQIVLTMATQDGVDVSFSTADLYLSLDDFSERILLPMMNNLAGDVASTIMSNNALALCNMNAKLDANNNLLTPDDSTYLNAQATLALNSTPPGVMQKIINDPRTEARVVSSLVGLLNPSAAITDQYYDGVMYRALGAIWYHDQTVIKSTTGTATTKAVSGANQTGTSLTISASAGTMVVGDIFTIAGVNAVNRVTKQTTGELRQFVVTVALAANGTTLNFYPAIVPSATGVAGGASVQYQTTDSSPIDTAVITPYLNASTTYRNNFRYAPQAITMATGDLPLPANKVTARHKYDNVSMRAITDYMIGTDQEITRLDVLFGSLTIRPEWGVRIPDII
jgi:P22 coat protein - gene protein 5